MQCLPSEAISFGIGAGLGSAIVYRTFSAFRGAALGAAGALSALLPVYAMRKATSCAIKRGTQGVKWLVGGGALLGGGMGAGAAFIPPAVSKDATASIAFLAGSVLATASAIVKAVRATKQDPSANTYRKAQVEVATALASSTAAIVVTLVNLSRSSE